MPPLSHRPLPCPSLGPREPAWPGYGGEDQKRSLCFVYETLPTPRGWGGGCCALPTAKATQTPQPLVPLASYGRAHTRAHTHTRTQACMGRGGPQGAGGTRGEGGEGGHLPKTTSAASQEKCITGPAVVGSTEVPSAPLPHTQGAAPGCNAERSQRPASSRLPLKTAFFL